MRREEWQVLDFAAAVTIAVSALGLRRALHHSGQFSSDAYLAPAIEEAGAANRPRGTDPQNNVTQDAR
jgi:hypothetical protein